MGSGTRLERLSLLISALQQAVLDEPATTGRDVRRAAFDGSATDAEVAGFVALVDQHPERVTDGRIAALREAGLTDDGIFEVTVAAAMGAAARRLASARELLETSE